jgi:hypothetical protein
MPLLAFFLESVALSLDVERGTVMEKVLTAIRPIVLKAITLNFAPASMQRPFGPRYTTIRSGDLMRVMLIADEDASMWISSHEAESRLQLSISEENC